MPQGRPPKTERKHPLERSWSELWVYAKDQASELWQLSGHAAASALPLANDLKSQTVATAAAVQDWATATTPAPPVAGDAMPQAAEAAPEARPVAEFAANAWSGATSVARMTISEVSTLAPQGFSSISAGTYSAASALSEGVSAMAFEEAPQSSGPATAAAATAPDALRKTKSASSKPRDDDGLFAVELTSTPPVLPAVTSQPPATGDATALQRQSLQPTYQNGEPVEDTKPPGA